MKPKQRETPKTHRLKENVIRRRRIISNVRDESSPSISPIEPRGRKKTTNKSEDKSAKLVLTSTPRLVVTSKSPKLVRTSKSPKLVVSSKSPRLITSSRYNLRNSLLLSPSHQSRTRQSLGKSIVKSCRATPFRTPKLKTKITNFKLQENKAMRPIWKQDIENLLDVSWKVCYLSSMTNFQFRNKNIRNIYEEVLRTKILGVGPFLNLVVKIEMSSCLSQNPQMTNALNIKVSSISPSEDEDEEVITPVYKAWFIASNQCQSISSSEVEWFPLMLYWGRETVHGAVIEWLQASFGCFVTPKMLQQSTMLWISAVWSKDRCLYKNHKDSNGNIFYNYHTKDRLNIGESVEIGLNFMRNDIRKLHDLIATEHAELTIPFLSEFHSTMQSFIYSFTYIPSDLLRLNRIKTSCFILDNHGRIRLTCPLKIPSLMNHLTELLLDMLNCGQIPESNTDSDSVTEEAE